MKSLYELLGASADDNAEALQKAFRKAVKAHHPDLHPSVLALTEDSQIGRRVRVCAYEDAGMHLAVS